MQNIWLGSERQVKRNRASKSLPSYPKAGEVLDRARHD